MFFLRQTDCRLILETIGGNECRSINQHLLIGATARYGENHFKVLRIAAEIRANAELAQQWYPLSFARESYPVTTAGGILAGSALSSRPANRRFPGGNARMPSCEMNEMTYACENWRAGPTT